MYSLPKLYHPPSLFAHFIQIKFDIPTSPSLAHSRHSIKSEFRFLCATAALIQLRQRGGCRLQFGEMCDDEIIRESGAWTNAIGSAREASKSISPTQRGAYFLRI